MHGPSPWQFISAASAASAYTPLHFSSMPESRRPRQLTALCVLCLLPWPCASASAHDATLTISRTNDPRPRLVVSAQPGLLQGRTAIELPPGDAPFTGMWIHDALDFAEASADEQPAGSCRPHAPHLIAVRRVRFDDGLCVFDPWSFSSILARDGEHFVLPSVDGLDLRILLMVGMAHSGTANGTFQLIDLIGTHDESAPFTLCFQSIGNAGDLPAVETYLCPMRCEGQKSYAQAGKCPECNMALRPPKAHMDHNPRHGGLFFMAPNGIHHLEGALFSPREFRLYIYNEYTEPLPAGDFTARGFAWTAGRDEERPITLRPGPDNAALTARLPGDLSFPIKLKIRVDFHDGQPTVVFDFEFDSEQRG